jgi:Fur family transcriptional regulator, peroxide stress response regulator
MALQRQTTQRKAILTVLRSSRGHPTADEVYDEVKKVMPRISRGTVYRNLHVLRERGDIGELDLSGTITRYEGTTERHYHFVCERCGQVIDLDMPVRHELDTEIEKRTGGTVSFHHLEFRGLCRDCRVRESEREEETI